MAKGDGNSGGGSSHGGGNFEDSSGRNPEGSSNDSSESTFYDNHGETSSVDSFEISSSDKSGSDISFEIAPVTDRSGGPHNSFEISAVSEKPSVTSGPEFRIDSVGVAKSTFSETAKVTDTVLTATPSFREKTSSPEIPAVVTSHPESREIRHEDTKLEDSPAGIERNAKAAERKSAQKTVEAFEEKVEAALREISLREYPRETLEQAEHECLTQTFRNGEGKDVSKAEATSIMLDDLDKALDSLRTDGREINADQKQAILDDARKALYSQEVESQSRGIGNHGISHIYGVYERVRDVPDEVLELAAANVRAKAPESAATASDIRAALIMAAVYHDEGYLAEQARKGPGKDGLHGIDSAIAFEQKHATLMRGAVDSFVLEDTRQAIAEHNVLPATPREALEKAGVTEDSPARQAVLEKVATEERADMNPNNNFVRSALLLSDKLAVDADEKLPDVLRDEERARVMVSYYQHQADRVSEDEKAQLMAQIKQEGISGEAAAAELAAREKALLSEKNAGKPEEMKQQLSEMVQNDERLTEAQKERYLAAIEKDINPNAGSFDLPMSGVTTPATALKFSVTTEGDRKQIAVEATIHHRMDDPIYMGSFGDKTGPEVANPPEGKKLRGALEDLGITEETLRRETSRTVDELLLQKDEDTYIVRTDGIDGLENVTLMVSRIDPETVKGNVNETVAAIEAQAEAERFREAEYEIRREAVNSFRESVERGEGSIENVLTLCGAVFEGNEAQVQEIVDKIQANPDMQEAEVQQLTERCLALCEADTKATPAETTKFIETDTAMSEVDPETYKSRIDHTPINHGAWMNEEGETGVRGESKFVPDSEDVKVTLAKYGVDGIDYRVGLPDFSPVCSFDAYLERDCFEASDIEQFEMCTLALQAEVIEDPDTGEILNPELASRFTEDQLLDISMGIVPEGYIWHHDVEEGHMQLVPIDVHQACTHLGGRSIWGGGAEARTAGRRSD